MKQCTHCLLAQHSAARTAGYSNETCDVEERVSKYGDAQREGVQVAHKAERNNAGDITQQVEQRDGPGEEEKPAWHSGIGTLQQWTSKS